MINGSCQLTSKCRSRQSKHCSTLIAEINHRFLKIQCQNFKTEHFTWVISQYWLVFVLVFVLLRTNRMHYISNLDNFSLFHYFCFQLKIFDKELEAFSDTLCEYPVTFPPSYPFEENTSSATSYMQTRCPAWCDRVIFSKNVKKLVEDDKPIEYGLMGINACMGDHKVRLENSNDVRDWGKMVWDIRKWMLSSKKSFYHVLMFYWTVWKNP